MGRIGRPSKFDQYKDQLKAMQEDGCSKAEMKRRTGLAYNTARKYLDHIQENK